MWWLTDKNRMLVSQCEHRYEAAANRNVTRREKTQVLITEFEFGIYWALIFSPARLCLSSWP